ncbi:MAG: sterol desaturase family protein [Novosphingobium sp.]
MFGFLKQVAQGDPFSLWLTGFMVIGLAAGILTGFFAARRIQPGRFKWSIFRNEAMFAVVNLSVTAWTLGPLNSFLRSHGYIVIKQDPAAWWMVAIEFAAYFLLFDTWFYWLHRGMHKEPIYKWVHKIHHKSTSPNLLTTFSESPLESLVNGGFLPVFLTASALLVGGLHQATVVLVIPFNILMGLYVHSGHEFLPRWWNKTWATKWFITTTFHDQHHKYFNYNFGGYTQIWDYAMGTVRKKYEADFEKPKARQTKAERPIETGQPALAA